MATERQCDDPEIEQIIADIKLKNRQQTTEVWKVALACIAVTAAIVQAFNWVGT